MRARSRVLLFTLLAAGCTLEPEATRSELDRAAQAGGEWSLPPAERRLPELTAAPTADEVVARALLANGDLEAAWHEWRAALQRVFVAAAWPNTDLEIGLSSWIDGGTVWDTSAVSIGFDPMQMLALPAKVRAAGEEALHEALAAGRRFESARLELRERALGAWLDWALLAERLRAAEAGADLSGAVADSAAAGQRVGGAQGDVLRRRIEAAERRGALEALRAEVPARRAELNALLARAPDAPLELPVALPAPRLRPSDATVLALGVAGNPELAELRDLLAARGVGLRRAGLEWFPDIAPSVDIATDETLASGGGHGGGGMEDSMSVMFTLPLNVPALRAAAQAAREDLAAASARVAQAERDAASRVLATLAALHGDEARVARLLELLPSAGALADGARQSYVHGGAGLGVLAEAQVAALDLRLALAEARVARERRLAALDRAVGVELRAPPPVAEAPDVVAQGGEP